MAGKKRVAKQPWQMTRDDFRQSMDTDAAAFQKVNEFSKAAHDRGLKPKPGVYAANVYHEDQVRKALSEGKPVPAEVLADYPDLAPECASLGR